MWKALCVQTAQQTLPDPKAGSQNTLVRSPDFYQGENHSQWGNGRKSRIGKQQFRLELESCWKTNRISAEPRSNNFPQLQMWRATSCAKCSVNLHLWPITTPDKGREVLSLIFQMLASHCCTQLESEQPVIWLYVCCTLTLNSLALQVCPCLRSFVSSPSKLQHT